MLNITLPVKAFGHYSADTEQLKTGESVVFTNIDIACHHALVMRLGILLETAVAYQNASFPSKSLNLIPLPPAL